MVNHEFECIISFIKELERLKDNTRTAWTKEGRPESVAEHSWRLSVFAMTIEEYFPGVDFNKVVRLCLVHDLGEAFEGDVSATIEVNQEEKLKREADAVNKLCAGLPGKIQNRLLSLWWEYNKGETSEAKLAKALDKMETIIQHNQGQNPPDFDYAFNLGYGREYSQFHPVITALREIIDTETANRDIEAKRFTAETPMKYLDLDHWPRKEHFLFFKQLDYPHFNVCANLDISRLLPYVKEKNHSFYNTFIYLTSRVANSMAEFRYRIQGERVVEYDVVHPSFTVMSGAGPFKYCTVAYESDIYAFYRLAERGIKKSESSDLLGDSQGRNDLLYITSIPWISFTSITHPIHLHPTDSIPRISWGKYFTESGTVKIPLSVQAHHAIMDGYHVGRYFEELQELVDHPEWYF